MDDVMKEKAVKAGKRYMEFHGFEYLGETSNGFHVFFNEEDGFRFANICMTYKSVDFAKSDVNTLRYDFEQAVLEWFMEHDKPIDQPIHCDEISLNIVADDRAIIKHFVNALH